MIKQIVVLVLLAVLANYCLQFYQQYKAGDGEAKKTSVKMFSYEELKASKEKNVLYLGILGKVYDVTKGAKHYGPGGSYEFFVGVDASRAFTTGKFADDLSDDILDLEQAQIADVFNWQQFFEKTYDFVGKINGRFYDENGEPTQALKDAETILASAQHKEKLNMEFSKRFPGCNSEWSQDKGGLVRVWCSTLSGGIERDWVGTPRLVKNPHTKSEQCACVNTDDLGHASVRKYEKCDTLGDTCQFIH